MEWLDITVRGALVCRYQCILCTAFGAFKSSILFQQVTCCAGFIGRHVLKPETTKRNVVLVVLFRLFRFIVSGYSTCLIGWLKYRIAFSLFFLYRKCFCLNLSVYENKERYPSFSQFETAKYWKFSINFISAFSWEVKNNTSQCNDRTKLIYIMASWVLLSPYTS